MSRIVLVQRRPSRTGLSKMCGMGVRNVCKTETHCAQRDSKASEMLCRQGVQIVQNVDCVHCAQRLSKVSECWLSNMCGMGIRNVYKTETHCAQRLSKVSECWLSKMCGMGVRNVYKTETHCAQRDSKASEMLCRQGVQIVQNVDCVHCAQRLSKVSECWLSNMCGIGVRNVRTRCPKYVVPNAHKPP